MISIRSFRSRIFLTLLAVSLVPATLTLVAAALVLGEVVAGAGTAGPWEQVARSGQALLDAVEQSPARSPAVEAALGAHRSALAESARLSQVYAFVGQRFLSLLPVFTLGLGLLILALALLAARYVSRSFSRPVHEIVGWTERLSRGEPLPAPVRPDDRGIREFARLRVAFRTMAERLDTLRARELEAARLRSWTDMARKVAHELKNPLTPMRFAAQRVATSPDPSIAEAGDVLLEEVDRLDELARSFTLFGRLPDGPRTVVEVGELLRSLTAREGMGEWVRLDIPPDLPPVAGHYDSLMRALRNLVTNAREAQAPGEQLVSVTAHALDGEVGIEILDRGPGIPGELHDRIWDPDFTTKPDGTGLGLQLVLETVRAHGGRVEASNREGGGASFRVRLPTVGSVQVD